MSDTLLKQVQLALAREGIDPGPIDGIKGPLTRQAIAAFQTGEGMEPTGRMDQALVSALLGPGSGAGSDGAELPDWLRLALSLRGTAEVRGPRHSRTIMGWAERLGIWYPDDETPWCGLFVAHVISTIFPDMALPSNVLGAQQWLNFGRRLDGPALGAVVVFWRGSPRSWKGHVGFYYGETRTHILCIGGNQSNTVNVTRIAKNRVKGYRWPNGVPVPTTGPVFRDAQGRVSHNEA